MPRYSPDYAHTLAGYESDVYVEWSDNGHRYRLASALLCSARCFSPATPFSRPRVAAAPECRSAAPQAAPATSCYPARLPICCAPSWPHLATTGTTPVSHGRHSTVRAPPRLPAASPLQTSARAAPSPHACTVAGFPGPPLGHERAAPGAPTSPAPTAPVALLQLLVCRLRTRRVLAGSALRRPRQPGL